MAKLSQIVIGGAAAIGAAALLGTPEDVARSVAPSPIAASERDEASPSSAEAQLSAASRKGGDLRTVTATSLRMRGSPSTSADVIASASRGTVVTVLAQQGDWVEVRLPSGAQGWMHGDYLSEPVTAADAGAGALPAAASERSADLRGRATVTDGDTIRIGDVRVRLFGIDAPESGQTCEDGAGRLYPCAGRAANALGDKIGRGTVTCQREDTDRYGRTVAVCTLASTGEDLNAFMVASGWALAYRTYSAAYIDEEAAAKRARRGLWQGRFIAPWDYRGGQRLERTRRASPGSGSSVSRSPSATPAAGPCLIKGNISKSGRIYHVPGSRWYEKTKIDARAGERWFCSEDEARAAGWRAPRG